MAHVKDIKIGNNTYLIEPTVYAATAGTASAITAAVSNFALDTGVVVTLKITTTNAADATLNVNSTGAKTLKYNNANLVASVLKVNRFYSFVYDGTYWQLIGELDTNTWRSISDAVNSNSSDVSASSKAVKTAYDLADGKVSKSGDTMTGSLIASASENSISNIKYYSHSSYAGKTYIGWIKILQIDLNDYNYLGNRTYDLYISRRFSSPSSEAYNIRVTIGWSTVNIIQLGSSVGGKIIEKFRVVRDNTNHKAFFEFFVNTSYTTYQNAVDIRITEYFPSTSNPTLLSEVQTEEESAFANKWEIELADNKIVGNITSADNANSVALSGVTGADDLKAIEALTGTSGLLKKTAANTWTLDTTAYTTNTGTVTSVAASGSGGISISDSPITTSGTIAIGLNLSTAINGLGEGTSPAQLNDYLVAQYAGGGTTTTTYHRRKVSNVVNATVVKAALSTNATHNNQFLRKDGTWQTPPYPVTSVAGNTGAITADTLRTSLGLSNAMHFLGVTTTNVSTGTANTTATVDISGSNVTAAAGDVVLYGSQEYVWGNSKWNLLGDESSYKVKQTAKSDPTASTTTSITFIDTISQDANGVITATKKTLPTASSTIAGITKVGASGGAAAYSHTHSYLANTNTGAADRPIYITGNAPAQTTYRMAGTNAVATAGLTYSNNLDTGIWYVNGITAADNPSNPGGAADGVIYAEKYNESWIHEIYGDYRTGQIAVRGKNNGTWQDWRRVLDSSNWKTLIGATTAAASATKYLREDGSWQVPVDTKNTAGSTNSTSRLYLIGATSQAANPTTNSYQYTYTDNGLLSALKLGLNLNGTEKAHLEWNNTDQSIDFIFN